MSSNVKITTNIINEDVCPSCTHVDQNVSFLKSDLYQKLAKIVVKRQISKKYEIILVVMYAFLIT